jgi:aminopeptidase
VADPRVLEHARIIVEHSCKVKKNDFVLITSNPEVQELVIAIAAQLGKVGAQYVVIDQSSSISRSYMLAADDETLSVLSPMMLEVIKGADVLINLSQASTSNSQEMSDVPPHKLQVMAVSMRPLVEIIDQKRWNITLHPTQGLAQEAKMSFEAYSDFVYSAIIRDWPKMASEMKVLADKMAATKTVHILGKDTDITFSIEGRKPLVDGGEKNLPGGEVFISPIDSSVEGHVYFDLPINFMGHDVKGARLSFKNGQVVESSAEEGTEILKALMSADPGAGRVGELGIGMNRGIDRFTKNILFDEKMGDTIHMAIGRAFAESGGTNQSAVHIDMIKTMKEGGKILFDDTPIYANGKFSWE